MSATQPRYMDATVQRLARSWKNDEDLPVAEIARRLGRSPSAARRLLGDEPGARSGVGRKAKLMDGDK